MYRICGDGCDQPRATLLELCSRTASPIAKTQGQIVELLEGWGSDSSAWKLFHCMGGDADNESSVLSAKAQLLQQAAAVVDHFELRMSQPPYTLVKLAEGDIPERAARKSLLSL